MADHIANIATRLQLMHAEITNGVDTITAFTDPPPVIKFDQLPLMYTVYDSFDETRINSQDVVRVYIFTAELMIKQAAASGITSGVSEGHKLVRDWIDDVVNYYDTHRRMMTNALPTTQLSYLYPDEGLSFKNDGVGEFVGTSATDRTVYFGSRFTLSIPMLVQGS